PQRRDRFATLAMTVGLGGPQRSAAGTDAGADRAGDAGAADAAVAAGVLRQVLLVVVLGEVEVGRAGDLGADRVAMPRRREGLSVGIARGLGGASLCLAVDVD